MSNEASFARGNMTVPQTHNFGPNCDDGGEEGRPDEARDKWRFA